MIRSGYVVKIEPIEFAEGLDIGYKKNRVIDNDFKGRWERLQGEQI